jgi:hypothetical protein
MRVSWVAFRKGFLKNVKEANNEKVQNRFGIYFGFDFFSDISIRKRSGAGQEDHGETG